MLCLRGLTKFSWRLERSLTTSGSLKMDSCLVLTECLSRRILRFRTSAIDLIHSERVSTSTSSFFAHRLAYSSHASMIMPKCWCHEYETGSLYFGPLLKRSLSFILRTILRLPNSPHTSHVSVIVEKYSFFPGVTSELNQTYEDLTAIFLKDFCFRLITIFLC